MRINLLCFVCVIVFITSNIYGQTNLKRRDSLAKETKNLIQSNHYNQADSLLQLMKKINNDSTSLNTTYTITLLTADLERAKGNQKQASKILSRIPLSKTDDKAILAEYYYLKSKLAGNNKEAKKLVKQGIKLKREIPVTGLTDLSDFYNTLGFYNLRLYNIDSAKHYFNKAIETALQKENKSQAHEHIALFYQNLAIPHAMSQNYEVAKQYFLKSISILDSSQQKAKNDLARNYINIGRLYLLTGSIDSATYYYKKAQNIRENLDNVSSQNLALIYNNLGELHSTKTNMAKARMYFQKAKKLYEKSKAKNQQRLHQINLNLGFTHKKKKEYAQSIKYFKQAIKSSNKITIGKAYRNMADSYSKLNQPDSAGYFFQKSISALKEAKNRGRYDLGLTYLYYGDFLVGQENDEALQYLTDGKDILVKIFGKFHRDVARANTYIAKYYLQKNDYTKALSYAQEAITYSVTDFDNPDPHANPSIEKLVNKNHLITAISLKGNAFFQSGQKNQNIKDLEAAYHTLETVIELINRVRLNYTYESNKLIITERSQEEHNLILKVLKELHKQTNDQKYLSAIFRYMEKSKSAVLLSSITDSKAKITANLPDSIIEKEKWLRTRINGFKNLVYEERQKKVGRRNEKKIDDWESIIFKSQQQYDSLTNFIKNEYNQYYKLRMKPSVMELDQVVDKLDKDEIILEYSILEDELIIFTITTDRQAFHTVDISKQQVNDLIQTLRDNLKVKAFVNFDRNSYNQFITTGYKLFQKLVDPVYDKTKGRDIIFVPDGRMGYIPFELLLTESMEDRLRNSKMNYKILPYLLKERSVSYSYSSTLLFSDIKEKTPSQKKILAMAPSYDNISNKPIDSIFTHRQGGEILLPIPGVGKEVKNISKTYKSNIFQDNEATEKMFKQKAPDYSVLHLAMHAIIDDEYPMYSKLVFYQNPDSSNEGLLNTYELFDLSLNAEMAVLSACNTGYGKLQRGEGIMSLARGFLYAGVPNIVMTLWPIEDESTSEIMELFYKQLAKGKEKDDALRQAKLLFLKNTNMLNAHPHFWASFVSIGPDTPLKNVREKNDYPYWIGGILLVIAAGWFIIKRNR